MGQSLSIAARERVSLVDDRNTRNLGRREEVMVVIGVQLKERASRKVMK